MSSNKNSKILSPAPAPVVTPAPVQVNNDTPANSIPFAQIARELGVNPKKARAQLRKSKAMQALTIPHDTRWHVLNTNVNAIKAMIKGKATPAPAPKA